MLDELLARSAGAMTGFAFPERLIATLRAWQNGGYEAARDAYIPWMPLVIHEFQDIIGLALWKEILRRRGLIAEASVRIPDAQALSSAFIPSPSAGAVKALGWFAVACGLRTC